MANLFGHRFDLLCDHNNNAGSSRKVANQANTFACVRYRAACRVQVSNIAQSMRQTTEQRKMAGQPFLRKAAYKTCRDVH
jgi:hypothetical protein